MPRPARPHADLMQMSRKHAAVPGSTTPAPAATHTPLLTPPGPVKSAFCALPTLPPWDTHHHDPRRSSSPMAPCPTSSCCATTALWWQATLMTWCRCSLRWVDPQSRCPDIFHLSLIAEGPCMRVLWHTRHLTFTQDHSVWLGRADRSKGQMRRRLTLGSCAHGVCCTHASIAASGSPLPTVLPCALQIPDGPLRAQQEAALAALGISLEHSLQDGPLSMQAREPSSSHSSRPRALTKGPPPPPPPLPHHHTHTHTHTPHPTPSLSPALAGMTRG